MALIVLPFSAPFSTCDITVVFADDDSQPGSLVAHSLVESLTDEMTSHALPVARAAVRVKFGILSEGAPVELASPPAPQRAPHDARTATVVPPPLVLPLRI